MLGESQAAIGHLFGRGWELNLADAELWFRKAVVTGIEANRARPSNAGGGSYTADRPDQRFCSINQGIYGHLTRRNLAALAARTR